MGTLSQDPNFHPFNHQWIVQKTKEQIREELSSELQSKFYKEYYLNARSSDEIIIDDNDLQEILKVSKRYTANLRANGLIRYSQPVEDGKIYYYLKDVFDFIDSGIQETISGKRRI